MERLPSDYVIIQVKLNQRTIGQVLREITQVKSSQKYLYKTLKSIIFYCSRQITNYILNQQKLVSI